MSTKHRKFLEDVFSHYSKGEIEAFFLYFDTHIQWTIHGDRDLVGRYNNIEDVKKKYKLYTDWLRDKPKHRLRYLVIEEDKAIAQLFDEVIGKDGRNYNLNYTLFLEISKEGNKILRVDHFLDSHQLLEIIKASTGKPRKVA